MDVLVFRDSLNTPGLRLHVGNCFGSKEVKLSDETEVELRVLLSKAMGEAEKNG